MAIKLAGGTTPYILKDDRESENPTVFNIKDLTASERGQLDEAYAALPAFQPDEEHVADGLANLMRAMDAAHRKACKICIESVTGVLDADGNVVADLSALDVIAKLRDPAHIRELGQAVLEANRLSEDEQGN